MPKKRNKNNGILTFVQPETHSFMTDNLNLNLSYVGADSKSVATESHISLILSNLFPKCLRHKQDFMQPISVA